MYYTPRMPEALAGLLPDIPSTSSDIAEHVKNRRARIHANPFLRRTANPIGDQIPSMQIEIYG
jgi:hypothetical protein